MSDEEVACSDGNVDVAMNLSHLVINFDLGIANDATSLIRLHDIRMKSIASMATWCMIGISILEPPLIGSIIYSQRFAN